VNLLLVRVMFERFKQRRHLAHAPPLTADAAEGSEAKLVGIVHALPKTLVAPATGQQAVAFRLRVMDRNLEPGAGPQGAPFDTTDACAFVVHDDRLGDVAVDSQFAELVLPVRPVRETHAGWQQWKDDRGIAFQHVPEQAAIVPGDRVVVVGTVARRTGGPEAAALRDAPSALCLVGDFDHPLLIAID
jgi:hypothetical protein